MSLSTTSFTTMTLRQCFTLQRNVVAASRSTRTSSRPLSDAASHGQVDNGIEMDSTSKWNQSSSSSISCASSSPSSSVDASFSPRTSSFTTGYHQTMFIQTPRSFNSPMSCLHLISHKLAPTLSPFHVQRAFFHHVTRQLVLPSSVVSTLPTNSSFSVQDLSLLSPDGRDLVLTIPARFKSKDKGGKNKGV